MKGPEIIRFKKYFSRYVRSFFSKDEEAQRNIILKIKHTFNVCKNIKAIASDSISDTNGMLLAETIALFHDIGRFKQYAKYKTFNDSLSVNHGLLGAEIIYKDAILICLPQDEQDLIINCIRFHNSLLIPDNIDNNTLQYLKLIRDADKLDIWRIFAGYFDTTEKERASAAMLGLPDTRDFSKNLLSYIYEKRLIPLSEVKTINDFILMQLSWAYDINFKKTYQMLLNMGYFKRLIKKLPDTEEIKNATSFVIHYLESKAEN